MTLVPWKKKRSPSPERERIGREVAARLEAAPGVIRAKSEHIQLYSIPGYMSDADCDLLIGMIDANSRPSTTLSKSKDPNFRTSDSCDLDRWAGDIFQIDSRIADLLGIAPEQGETIQGQRYAPGQQFRAHHDYFHKGEPYWDAMMKGGGQRTWTAMVYLNDVMEGGATWFPQAGVRVAPKRGLLLAWNNMAPDGSPNLATLHEGMAVVKGTKYIITKWFREKSWLR